MLDVNFFLSYLYDTVSLFIASTRCPILLCT